MKTARAALFLLFSMTSPWLYAQQKKNFILRTIDWGYRMVEGDSLNPHKKYLIPIPIFAYKPESKWIFGISTAHIFRTRNNDGSTRPTTIRLNVAYSQLKQFSLIPYLEYFSPGNKTCIRSQFTYTNFAEYYWGMGSNTPDAARELYHFNMQKAFFKAAWLIDGKWYAGLNYGFEKMYNLSYEASGKLQTSGYYGHQGYTASGLGYTVFHDSRDNLFFPFTGNFLEVSHRLYHPVFGSKYGFNAFSIDARSYHRLWNENVLAFQFVASFNGGAVPFRMQAALGSDSYMRGYYNGRFRDQHGFAFQTELRKTIWGPVGCVVFAGCGAVAANPASLTSSVLPNVGAGLRVKAIPRERLNMRMDYGIGSKGNAALYITLQEAF